MKNTYIQYCTSNNSHKAVYCVYILCYVALHAVCVSNIVVGDLFWLNNKRTETMNNVSGALWLLHEKKSTNKGRMICDKL